MSVSISERIPDFAPQLYASGESCRPIRDVKQITDDLWSVWAEYDLKPTPIRLFVRDGSLKDKYGDDLVDQSRAAAVIRKGRVEQDRVEAELLGVERLRDLLLSGDARDGVIYLSPPGRETEGFGADGKHRLSFTYLYHVGNEGRIHFVAVPELEISIKNHLAKVTNAINQNATEKIVGVPINSKDDRGLVAYPLVAKDKSSMDEMAKKFGYKDLLGMWKTALEARRLRGRVGELIKHVGGKIWESRSGLDQDELGAMGDVFRGMVALLTGPGLDDVKDLTGYFDNKIQALIASRKIDRLGGVTYEGYTRLAFELSEFYWRMETNPYALDKVQGGSCPGDRGLGFEVNNHVMIDVLSGDIQEKSEETYSFDHEGQCVVCKQDPRMLGPCNICEECDHKMRSQGE